MSDKPLEEMDERDFTIQARIEKALAHDGEIARVWKTDNDLPTRRLVANVCGVLMASLLTDPTGKVTIDGVVSTAFLLGMQAQRQGWRATMARNVRKTGK